MIIHYKEKKEYGGQVDPKEVQWGLVKARALCRTLKFCKHTMCVGLCMMAAS